MTEKSKDQATAESKVSDSVKKLADAIVAGTTLDTATGVVSENGDLFVDHLPEGVTTKQVADVDAYRTEFVAAGVRALGQIAVPAMAKDKNLNACTIELKAGGRDKFSARTDRVKKFVTPGASAGAGETFTRLGATTASYTAGAGQKTSKSSQLNLAMKAITEAATAALK